MGLRSGGIFRVSLLRLTTLLLRFRPYEGWKVLFRMVGRPAGRPVGRSEKLGIEPATAQLELGLGLSLAIKMLTWKISSGYEGVRRQGDRFVRNIDESDEMIKERDVILASRHADDKLDLRVLMDNR